MIATDIINMRKLQRHSKHKQKAKTLVSELASRQISVSTNFFSRAAHAYTWLELHAT